MPVKHLHDIDEVRMTNGVGVTKQVLISLSEAPNFEMRCFSIQPGGEMPNHTNQVEHEQFVLSGQAQIGIGDEKFDVQQGDVVLIPAGLPHWYRNTGSEVFKFMCLVPNQPDKVTLV